jgi:hypothetical protein
MAGSIALLSRRLTRLAAKARSEHRSIRLLWSDEFLPCSRHHDCEVDLESGEHHQHVIHLCFTDTRNQ